MNQNQTYPGNTQPVYGNTVIMPPATPMREGGFQMRLLEVHKMLSDALMTMSRIEQACGTQQPKPESNIAQQGPLDLNRLCIDINASSRELCDRLARLEASI